MAAPRRARRAGGLGPVLAEANGRVDGWDDDGENEGGGKKIEQKKTEIKRGWMMQ
jgi:hypothetical protein